MTQPIQPDSQQTPPQSGDQSASNQTSDVNSPGSGDAGNVQTSGEQPAPAAPEQPQQETPQTQPGEPLGDKAPPVSDFQNQQCPNCTTGILYVIRYDKDALYERGQGKALESGYESGGSVELHCAACDYSVTKPLNPGRLWGTQRGGDQ